MPLLSVIAPAHCNTSDILTHILPYCGTIQTLSRLSQTSKELRMLIMHSPDGKRAWLEMVGKLTGHSAKHHISVSCHDFFDKVKLMACPWLVIPQNLPSIVGPSMEIEDIRFTLFDGDNGVALWDFDFSSEEGFQLANISKSRPENKNWVFIGNTEDIPRPVDKIPKTEFRQINQPEELPILTYNEDYRYFYQKIHKSAFAVIEAVVESPDNNTGADLHSGIFFLSKKGGRVLRHVTLPDVFPAPTNMIVRPMEMWMLTEQRVLYFGPSGIRLPLTAEGRMDRAMWFVGNGRARKAMRALSELGITDINTHSETGRMTLLHVATLHNQTQAARILLMAKADPEARDDRGLTCVMIAALTKNPGMVRLLCKEGSAQPNATTNLYNETALHVMGHCRIKTAERSKEETVKALLDCMADPNLEDAKGQTPLFSYAILDCPRTVDLLCSVGGANPMHRDRTGMTPLHALFDVSHERRSATMLVKKFGADVDAKDDEGRTALMLAANARTLVDVKVLLGDLDANPLLCDHEGRDALWFAKNGEDNQVQARAVMRVIRAKVVERRKKG